MRIMILNDIKGGPKQGESFDARYLPDSPVGDYQIIEVGNYTGIIVASTDAREIPDDKLSVEELVYVTHKNAKEKGWWDGRRSFGDLIALMHSELSEALEEHRDGRHYTEIYYEGNGKPCGIPIELADTVIRIFDACGYYGIDL
ncbi:hypothetical protein ABNF65_24645, partial [Paenibacillus larvae]